MSTKIQDIIEELKTLTLLEAAELVKQIEETFGVDTSVAQVSNSITTPLEGTTSSSSDQVEKTEFDLHLEEVPAPKKIAILKIVRSLTGLGLKEAKDMVDSVPKLIKEGVSKEDVEDMKSKLEEAGAKVSVK